MMTEKESRLFYEGLRLFNSGHYYEAHEEWEQIWLHRMGPDRDFFQGLIILAGAFCHLKKNKARPAWVAFTKAKKKLQAFTPYYLEIELDSLMTFLDQCLNAIQSDDLKAIQTPRLGSFD